MITPKNEYSFVYSIIASLRAKPKGIRGDVLVHIAIHMMGLGRRSTDTIMRHRSINLVDEPGAGCLPQAQL
jgi:hypothetical protein